MGFFPFLLTDMVEVPAFGSLSSPPDSGYPVISSTFPSSCCVDPTIGCGLIMSDFSAHCHPHLFLWVALPSHVVVGCLW
jgi:hypothetical protein